MTHNITSIEYIKMLAKEAALQFTSAQDCNPYIDDTDAAALFKKHFEIERTYLEQETALETQTTNDISQNAALDITHSLDQFEALEGAAA